MKTRHHGTRARGAWLLAAALSLPSAAWAQSPRAPETNTPSATSAGDGEPDAKKRPRKKRNRKGKGRVRVIIDGGWATVTVNGYDAGRTPTDFEVTPGTKTIYIFPFGKSPHVRRQVEVKAGAEAVVRLRLERPKPRSQ